MLEALAALSLASAIVQLVDFGGKLLLRGYDAYKSVEGFDTERTQLAKQTANIQSASQNLRTSSNCSASKDETLLLSLAKDSDEVSQELLNLLNGLAVKGKGAARAIACVRKQFKGRWRSEKIRKLQEQLTQIQQQVGNCLLSILRDQTASVTRALTDLMRTTQEDHDQLLGLTQSIIADLKETRIDCAKLYASLSRLSDEAERTTKVHSILKSLSFEEIDERRTRVKQNHPSTFAWVFEQETTPFKTWLESHGGIFWITGKAGSGKSTLLKFVVSHAYTNELLQAWANGSELIIAQFFFWDPGTPLQKALEGMWRTILFQVFRQRPNLIPVVCKNRWNAIENFKEDPPRWSLEELHATLNALVHDPTLPVRCCFFVDGLDECEEDDRIDLVSYLAGYAASSRVKFCVSSRPHNVFNEEYGKHQARMIEIHRHTRPDIEAYIEGELESCAKFVQLCHREPSAVCIVREISDRASGVFLWVSLVIKDIRNGLSERDKVSMLMKRVRSVPKDLKGLFEHILDHIDPIYRIHSARALQIALHADGPRPLLAYWLLEHDIEDSNAALNQECAPPSENEVEEMEEEARCRINSWCRDLLEPVCNDMPGCLDYASSAALISLNNWKVNLLHRTVKEFLSEPAMQLRLQSQANDFELMPTLSRLYLGQTKWLHPSVEAATRMSGFLNLSSKLMRTARQAEAQNQMHSIPAVLQELDEVGTHLQLGVRGRREHWSNYNLSLTKLHPCSSFLAYCVAFGLCGYVTRIIDSMLEIQRIALNPLYFFATDPPLIYGSGAVNADLALSRQALTRILLEKGVSYKECINVKGEIGEDCWVGELRRTTDAVAFHCVFRSRTTFDRTVDCLDPYCQHNCPQPDLDSDNTSMSSLDSAEREVIKSEHKQKARPRQKDDLSLHRCYARDQ